MIPPYPAWLEPPFVPQSLPEYPSSQKHLTASTSASVLHIPCPPQTKPLFFSMGHSVGQPCIENIVISYWQWLGSVAWSYLGSFALVSHMILLLPWGRNWVVALTPTFKNHFTPFDLSEVSTGLCLRQRSTQQHSTPFRPFGWQQPYLRSHPVGNDHYSYM